MSPPPDAARSDQFAGGGDDVRAIAVPASLSLPLTSAPVAWVAGRWPQWDWRRGELLWAGWEDQRPVWRGVSQVGLGLLRVRGTADPARDAAWARSVLAVHQVCPAFSDPVVEHLRHRFAGMRPLGAGSLFDGLVTAIVGQSISIRAAATVLRRVAGLFEAVIGPAGCVLIPLPPPERMAAGNRDAIRATGVTWRRADALIAAGRAFSADPEHWDVAATGIEEARLRLRTLPLVGPWTAEAALLWGISAPDAHVAGDVALLRSARAAYGRPGLTMRELDALAGAWRPGRAWAARLLWCDQLGVPVDEFSAAPIEEWMDGEER